MPDNSDFVSASTLRRPAPSLNRGYRYLSVDAATMRVTNEFDFSQVQYTFERNAPGLFGAALDLYSPDSQFLIPQETYIVVERAGQPFWCGMFWKPIRNGKLLEIGAQGVWSIFGHRHIRDTKSYNNVDRAAIARDLVTYAQLGVGGDIHVATGSELLGGSPLPTALYPWWEDKVVATEVEALAAMDPQFNFSIDGSWLPGNILTFNFNVDIVHPDPTPYRLVYGSNVDDYEWESIAPSPNHVDAFGGFDGPAMLRRWAENATALERQPRIEVSTGNRDIMSEPAIQDLAVSTVRKLSGSPSQPSVSMQASSDPELGVLKLGQEVEVEIRDGYIFVQGKYIIEKIEVTVPDGAADALGSETMKISFESLVDDALIGTL